MRYPTTLAAAVTGLLLLAAPAAANTIHVDVQNDEDDGSCAPGDCSLREAVKYAGVGDLIDVPPGDYELGSELVVPRTMTIDGAGPASTTITGSGSARAMHVTAGPLTLRDVKVTNGLGDGFGGGILDMSGELLTLDRVRITENASNVSTGTIAADGAAGVAAVGPVRVTRSTIDNNVTSLSATDGLTASGGGGIYVDHAALEVVDSEIRDNRVLIHGATSTDAPVTRNGGGGIYVAGASGSLTLTRSTLAGNTASVNGDTMVNDNGGGGIYLNGAPFTAVNSTLSNNEAHVPAFLIDNGGGGIFSKDATGQLTNVTLSHNIASGTTGMDSGGGLYRDGGSVKARNTIIARNTADTGANCFGSIVSQGRNLEDKNTCGLTGAGDLVNRDPLLGALAANGGPTRTRAIGKFSPALDTGAACPATDQRGVMRPKGNACDRGAYEAEVPTVVTRETKSVGLHSARLLGRVTPNGTATIYAFQYGRTTPYAKATKPKSAGAGRAAKTVGVTVKGLRPRTTYHYRLVASNMFGTVRGRDRKFTTKTPLPKRCIDGGKLSFKLKPPKGTKILSIDATFEGKNKSFVGRKVELTGLPAKRFKLRVIAHLANATGMRGSRKYAPCG